MNLNFNMVKKPKKEDEIIEDEEEFELEEEKEQRVKNDAARKRMFTMMGIIVGGMIVLLLVLFIMSMFTSKTYSFTEIEKIVKDAAISYFKDHPESLPMDEESVVEIDSSNLVVAEKMKDLSEYTKEGVLCSATVQVEKSGEEYLYTPYLNCGENYATEELYKRLIKDENLVNSGYGLYAVNGAYVYRGELVNNYVQLDNSLWRIVKITANNNIVLVSNEGMLYSQPWDNRYNPEKNMGSGFNTYSTSRVKEYLEKIYDNPNEKNGELVLSNSDKAKMVPFNLCTGKKAATSEAKDNVEECNEVIQNQRIGLLTLSDYLSASIDPKCVNSLSKTCQNYNYLSNKNAFWLITPDSADSTSVFAVEDNGVVKSQYASNYYSVRPVIYLNSKVLYKSGDGTLEKPYKLK